MKTIKKILFAALGVFVLASCNNKDNEPTSVYTGETAAVNFQINAKSLGKSMESSKFRAYSPTYTSGGFSIYAFRKQVGGSDYLFERSINVGNFTYANDLLTGQENLPVGTYKFLPAYGLTTQSSILTLSPLSQGSTVLTDDLRISYNGTSPIAQEIFLQTQDDAANLTSYEIATTPADNPTVAATLKRAVGRVDVMFIAADKNSDGSYTERATGSGVDIFGNRTVESLQLQFSGLNNVMNVFGVNKTVSRTAYNVNLANLSNIIVIGDGMSTQVGETGYSRFDNVQTNDIIQGGAHVFGTYLFPNADETANVGLDLLIKLSGVDARPIQITSKNGTYLPIEKNKVTLVKIYVLNGNDVGTSTVEFEYELDVVWEEPHVIEGEIS